MPLDLTNTLTHRKERFAPLDPDHVGMYVCGPTVYDRAHVGNARPVVVFDVLYRLLRRLYPRVTYVRNITDVDDKINAAAQAANISIQELTEGTTARFHQDMAALNTLAPDVEPRATAHIGDMIAMIATLIERSHAYAAQGHVLFHVPSMATYGRLSGRDRDDLIAGARVEVAPYKRDPADFVLWKPSTDDLPGWDSPWGRGRPGWHLECSAMSARYLGQTFDIHGGGQDLVFPHHENEIAQSCCAHGTEALARYWLHNGYVVVNGEKMSKSLGNFITVHDLLADHPGEAVRLTLLSAHYRQPLDVTVDALTQARRELDRWYRALEALDDVEAAGDEVPLPLLAALEDDLNTPLAISEMHALAARVFHDPAPAERPRLKGALLASGRLLGVLAQAPADWFRADTGALSPDQVEDMIERRQAARRDRDFATADRLRDELTAAGIVLEDGPDGTKWRRA